MSGVGLTCAAPADPRRSHQKAAASTTIDTSWPARRHVSALTTGASVAPIVLIQPVSDRLPRPANARAYFGATTVAYSTLSCQPTTTSATPVHATAVPAPHASGAHLRRHAR